MPAMVVTPWGDQQTFASRFAGKKARFCLANNTTGLTDASTTSQWDASELTGNGYARYVWTIPAGSYNSTTSRFEAPTELAQFQASSGGTGLAWNTAYVVLGTETGGVTTWETGVQMLLADSQALAPGEPRGYVVKLLADGLTVSS